MKIRGLVAVCAAVLLSAPAFPQRASNPSTSRAQALRFSGYVVDQADLLTARQRQAFTVRLGRYQRETKHQLAIITVSTLGGADVATFTTDLANRWGVGRRGVNDGVLILVAPNERKARIAVGRGLERRLTDPFCQSVMTTKMVPAFKAGQFAKGLDAGTNAIIARLAETER